MAVSEDTGFLQEIQNWSPDRVLLREVASNTTSGLSERIAMEHGKPGDLDRHQKDTATFHFTPSCDCAHDDIRLKKKVRILMK